MAGTKTMRVSHGRYVSAGYTRQEQQTKQKKDLYIAEDPAGSARENLRDLNKTGYRAERPWRETPDPALQQQEEPKPEKIRPVRKAAKKKQMGPVDHLLAEIRRDRTGVTICAMLAATMLVMAVAWGRNMVSGVNIQRDIERYQAQTITLQRENEKLSQQLEIAESGERIRNLAQNELGMLRRERAQTETIYIQAPEKKAQEGAQANSQTHMEILDFLLGLLNVFHIGE